MDVIIFRQLFTTIKNTTYFIVPQIVISLRHCQECKSLGQGHNHKGLKLDHDTESLGQLLLHVPLPHYQVRGY